MSDSSDFPSGKLFDDLKKYSSTFKDLNVAVIIHDDEGEIFSANDKFLHTLGYSESETLTLSLRNIVAEESRETFKTIFEETMTQGSSSHKIVIKKKNRTPFPVQVYSSILEIGGAKFIQCVLLDATEQENTEHELYNTNQFLDSIIENIPDMVFLKDAKELRFVRFNKAGEDLLGYSRDKLIGKNDYDFFTKEEADFFIEKDKATLASSEPIDIPEEEIHTKSKGTRTLHTKKITIRDENGNPNYLLGISEDITERKLLEQNDRIKEMAFESIADGIVIASTKDSDFKVIYCNASFEKMTGYSRDEIVGKNCRFLQANDCDQETLKLLREALNEKKPFRGLLRNYKKDGTLFWNELTISPVKNASGNVTHFIGIQNDVTEQVKVKEELKKGHDELEQRVRDRTSELSKLNDQLRKEALVRKNTEVALESNLEELSRKNRYEEIISTITRSIHTSIDLQTVLENSIEAMRKNIDKLDIASIYLVEGNEIVLKAQKGFTPDYIKRAGRIPHPKGATWQTIIDRKSRYVTDVASDKSLGKAGRDMGFECYLIVPLFIDDDVVGTVTIVSFEKNVFDKEELRLLEIVSKQISIAIRKAKQAEELIESEERYRILFEQSPVGVYLFDRDLEITNCNQQMVVMLQSSYENIIGQSIRDLKCKTFLGATEKTLEGRHSYQEDIYQATTSSAELWLSQHFSPILDSQGNVIGGIGVAEDITERKKAEELASQLGIILEESLNEVYIADIETLRFIQVNEGARRNLGYTIEELQQMSPMDIKTDLKKKDFQNLVDPLLSGKTEKIKHLSTHWRKDGSSYPVETNLQISTFKGKKVFVANVLDITEQERAHSLLLSEKRILEMISQGEWLSKILDQICLEAENQSNMMLCSFLLVDESGKSLLTKSAPNLPKEYLEETKLVPIGPNIGSCGTASYTKEQVIVADIENDPKWTDFKDLAVRNNLRACWSTPILSQSGELFGTFAMYYPEPRSPNNREFDIIERATHMARIAVERTKSEEALGKNIEKLSRKSRYEEIISTVTRSVHSSLDLQEVLQNSVDAMHENIAHAENVGIFFVEGDFAVNKAHRGYSKKLLDKVKKIPHPKGFTWKTIIEGKSLYSSDAEKDTIIGPAGKKEGTKSYASMPVKLRDKTIGCITINSFQKNAFDNEDLKLLDIVAQQIGVAINNANQAEALKKSEENLKENLDILHIKSRYEEVINAVTTSIHQSLELDEVFNNAVEAISRKVKEAKNVVIFMVEGDMKDKENPPQAVMKANRGYSDSFVKRLKTIPYPKGATWKTIRDGETRYVPDTDKDTAIGPAGREFGTKSYISMPLNYQNKTVGCMHIHSSRKNGFSQDDIKLLDIVTRQLETAIANASQAEALKKSEETLTYNLDQLYKKQQYEEIISTVTRSVHSSLDLDEVLNNAAETLHNNVDHADHVAMYMVEGDTAILRSSTGYPKWFTDRVARIPKPKGFTWKTLSEGVPQFVPNTTTDSPIGPAGREVGTMSYASMPINFNFTTIGCINISSRTPGAFDQEEIKLLEIVATQIESAINNAKQAEALRLSREELGESREHFRLLVETTNVIPWEYDPKAERFTYVGPQVEKLLGYPANDWYQENFWPSHIHLDDRDKILNECGLATLRMQDHELEYRMLTKNGEVIWLYEMVSVISENGEPKTLRGFMIDITERMESEKKLQDAFSEIETLKDKLEKENVYLKKEIELSYSHSDIIGDSKVMKSALNKIEQVAATDATVLLTGETGTGKELFANRIHNLSNRKDRAMVKVNCAALPPHLIESELFGHEKGAFTGAVSKNIGRFEVADDSTIFLDEVAELPLELQSKLLRVLQEGEFQRVGSAKTVKVNVRVITASNNQLLEAVRMGKFREDLFYRLNVFPIEIPPLRERKEDITNLLWFFISEFEEKMNKEIKNISRKDMENLINYPWPGNIRQLRNVIERSMIITSGPDLKIEIPGITSERAPTEIKEMEEVERDHISY
ncbi:MAG: PAS domain S-box protein, partial [Thermodesulfobacteriota bacterium]